MIIAAFYKGKGTFFDWLIRVWTRSPYSHVELIIDDVWYSSSPRDGRVRAAKIIPKEDHWDYVILPCSHSAEQEAVNTFHSQLGKPYDIIGILLSQVFPLGIDDPSSWFCSEICSCVLQKVHLIDRKHKASWYSPARLYKKLVQNS